MGLLFVLLVGGFNLNISNFNRLLTLLLVFSYILTYLLSLILQILSLGFGLFNSLNQTAAFSIGGKCYLEEILTFFLLDLHNVGNLCRFIIDPTYEQSQQK